MIEIDGAAGEGGGQIVRSALSLSLLTGRPFTIHQIRGKRQKPGLLRQHLTAVKAAARIGAAEIEGAHLGSDRLVFRPQALCPGHYDLAIGSAGSTTLVAQTLLPALLRADGPSTLEIAGGTHNPAAPTYDFFDQIYLGALDQMGATVSRRLLAPGFFPAAGGKIQVEITPSALSPVTFDQRAGDLQWSARILIAHLPVQIAEREREILAAGLGLPADALNVEICDEAARGPGNVIILTARQGPTVAQFTGFGRKGVKAERVADEVVEAAKAWLSAGAPVGPHLADQLILPLALAGGGGFTTQAPQPHTHTQIETVRRFLDVPIHLRRLTDEGAGPRAWRLTVGEDTPQPDEDRDP